MVAMDRDFRCTCWRGVEITHPADWELIAASAFGAPGSCVFADRRHERLKVQWRPLKRAPNLNKMLEEKRRSPEDAIAVLSEQPPGWHGTVETVERGSVVHAGRFFADSGLLLEAVLMWPGKRDRKMEDAVLTSMRPAPDTGAQRTWQAMGLRVKAGSNYDLLRFKADVGQTTWDFGPPSGKTPVLGVRQLALPHYWLTVPLEEWLDTQLDETWRKKFRKRTLINDHTAARRISVGQGRIRDKLKGQERVRVDIAWQCPVEDRVYHLHYEETTAAHEVFVPDHVAVECCAPYRPPGGGETMRRGRKSRVGSPSAQGAPSTADILEAVPMVNRVANITRGSRGGALAEVPLRNPWYMGGPVRWVFPVPDTRRVNLDVLGVTVLDLCDGIRTVERIVLEFAIRHRLSFLEAQKPVMEYMRQLAQRGILAVAGLKGNHQEP